MCQFPYEYQFYGTGRVRDLFLKIRIKHVCILLQFCRCVNFLHDHAGEHYVLLHWYDEITNDFGLHAETKLFGYVYPLQTRL